MERDRLIRLAQEVVAGVDQLKCRLAAACVVSSVAADDFTPASDVDILMVAADGKGRSKIWRRLVEGRVFEWVIVAKGDLDDVDAILGDAGLTHDLLTAVIIRDEGRWLQGIQECVVSRHRDQASIWLRATNQLDRLRWASERMSRHVAQGEILPAQRSHVSVLKAVFGLPRALLNRRCTMTRALPFCREAATELDLPGYVADALQLFGAAKVDAPCVRELHVLAKQMVTASRFTPDEQAIRLRHLEGSRWLLDHAQPADAVWPLYFWSSANVEEAGGQNNASIWDDWLRFACVLSIATKEDLHRKVDLAEKIIRSAVQLTEKHKNSLELNGMGSQPGAEADAGKPRR